MIHFAQAIERGSPFFSFIIGLGIAAILFHRNYSTVLTLGVPVKDAVDKVVKVDGKCYRYRVEDASCENTSNE
mgnify:CR=1 FL=1|jgi:hypothetical protein